MFLKNALFMSISLMWSLKSRTFIGLDYRLLKEFILAYQANYLIWSYLWVLKIYLINCISISKLFKNDKKIIKAWNISIK